MLLRGSATALLCGLGMLVSTSQPALAETIQCNGVSGEALQIDQVWRGALAQGARGKDFILRIEEGQANALRLDAGFLRIDEPAAEDLQTQQVQQAPVETSYATGLLELTIQAIEEGKPSRRRLYPPSQQFDGLLVGGLQLQVDTIDGQRFLVPRLDPGCYLVRLASPQGGGEAEVLARPGVQTDAPPTIATAAIALDAEQEVNLSFAVTQALLFRGTQGQRVRIDLTRPESADYALDPTVTLIGLANPPESNEAAMAATGWNQVGFDDDGAGNLNSRLELALPFSGLFAIAPGSISGEGAAILRLTGGEAARLGMSQGLSANSQWVPAESDETFFSVPSGATEIQAGADYPFDLGIDNPLSPGSFIALQAAYQRPDGSWSIVLPANRPRNLVIRIGNGGRIRACRSTCPAIEPDPSLSM